MEDQMEEENVSPAERTQRPTRGADAHSESSSSSLTSLFRLGRFQQRGDSKPMRT